MAQDEPARVEQGKRPRRSVILKFCEAFGDHPLFDGTLAELAYTYFFDETKDRGAEQEGVTEGPYGYLKLETSDVKTRDIDTYVEILADPARYAQFESELMDAYFLDDIDMFPFEDSAGKAEGPSGFKEIAKPKDFFFLQKQMIERRFAPRAEATAGEIGESDLRMLISRLRWVFLKNYAHLILHRRRLVLGLIVLMLSVAGAAMAFDAATSPPLYQQVLALTAWAGFLAGTVFWFLPWDFTNHRNHYVAALDASCNGLARPLQLRLHDLVATIPLIFAKVDRSKMEFKNEDRLKEWPSEIKKWSKLAFWMAARVEHIELYMQVQMWRVRRFHFGLRWIGRKLTGLLKALVYGFGVAAVIALGGYVAGLPEWRQVSGAIESGDASALWPLVCVIGRDLWFPAAFGGLTLVAAWLAARATFRNAVPDVDLVEKTLRTSTMQGFRDVKLHDQISELLFREKMSLLHEEGKLQR